MLPVADTITVRSGHHLYDISPLGLALIPLLLLLGSGVATWVAWRLAVDQW